MQGQHLTVYVIDDDPSVRDGLDSLLRSVGYETRGFASPRDFLTYPRSEGPACIVLDVRMPDASGLDFQDELARMGYAIPIIFLTGHGDVPMSVRAMKAGAVEFLLKPFREQDLLDAIRQALEIDRARLRKQAAEVDLHERFSTLTPREREVMALVARGLLNKQIAGEIGLSEITVKVHRGQAMRKMRADSVADLIRMADSLGLTDGKANDAVLGPR
ncbi:MULTISPECIES: response regulator transcription factor [unclassified Rhizobium]|jgi:FixJ family two-component response regulator|uniref:response regulator transcription factor n=1 Tax=unclassified Rhizobium TaxID=2613769 RepID=UPI00064834FA|nr:MULTISPECIES: response regulator transcription factor [unclassified Rhizobium]MBN8951427.1 response regulator transcription factor [Rhizobium tropici]OJY74759.1 MAG: DNA-binding response regulator [Rhizobium sp. 60-20]RKD66730.1 LuxR family two component transcriptional regulator [Rhizobium sp. WW_1]